MQEQEKLVDFCYGSFQAVRRAQKHYLAVQLVLLAFVWVSYWGKAKGAAAASLFGMPVPYQSLLGITPGISTILLLGLLGSLRAVKPAFQRLEYAWSNAGGTVQLQPEFIDHHQGWVDYLGLIWSNRFADFIHAAVLAMALASTIAVGLILVPEFKGYAAFLFASYCVLCLVAQSAAAWKWIAEKVAAQHSAKRATALSAN